LEVNFLKNFELENNKCYNFFKKMKLEKGNYTFYKFIFVLKTNENVEEKLLKSFLDKIKKDIQSIKQSKLIKIIDIGKKFFCFKGRKKPSENLEGRFIQLDIRSNKNFPKKIMEKIKYKNDILKFLILKGK
jgi:ribosomal protein S6